MRAVYRDRLILHFYRLPFTFVLNKRWLTCVLLSACLGLVGWDVLAQTSSLQTFKGTPHDEVQKSMIQRNWSEALQQVDAYLVNQPRDPQMRFWRARLMQQMQRNDEALDVYVQLAQDYPELPEVQNNLGVMLAAMGKIDEAKAAFEHALRNNPNYATAHENLGDVQLHLAMRSLQKAQSLGGGSRALNTKLQALQPVLQTTMSPP
jgi:Tfp pilus assembly protein PilF